jgi:hypothetical protein
MQTRNDTSCCGTAGRRALLTSSLRVRFDSPWYVLGGTVRGGTRMYPLTRGSVLIAPAVEALSLQQMKEDSGGLPLLRR